MGRLRGYTTVWGFTLGTVTLIDVHIWRQEVVGGRATFGCGIGSRKMGGLGRKVTFGCGVRVEKKYFFEGGDPVASHAFDTAAFDTAANPHGRLAHANRESIRVGG